MPTLLLTVRQAKFPTKLRNMAFDINVNTIIYAFSKAVGHAQNAKCPTIYPFGINGNTPSFSPSDSQTSSFFHASHGMRH